MQGLYSRVPLQQTPGSLRGLGFRAGGGGEEAATAHPGGTDGLPSARPSSEHVLYRAHGAGAQSESDCRSR